MFQIPGHVNRVLAALRGAGYEAYPVGGCVRDSLLGTTPSDWDVCTSARPDETAALFAHERLIETGMRHGTVTVLTAGGPVEITTFRADGTYQDGRHPDSVTFLPSLEGDLARRDFTVNAMALAPDGSVIDLYGGQADLAAGLIRCVGEPDKRFGEDALRILRAVRFASKLDFAVEPATAASAVENRALLDAIARERVFAELKGILMGTGVGRALLAYAPVIFQVIPELAAGQGFEQHNPHHIHDVWTHTAMAVAAAPPDPTVRLTMLLHDVAKPDTFFLDEKGVGHFYGHGEKGAEMADGILRRLRCDNDTRERVCLLIRNHDICPPQTEKAMRRLLAKVGQEAVGQLLDCWRADCADRADAVLPADTPWGTLIGTSERILAELFAEPAPCFGLKDLAVNGRDILALGAKPGPAVGQVLAELLDGVVDGALPNERQALLARAGQLLEKGLQ